jgi:hypothetical protein
MHEERRRMTIDSGVRQRFLLASGIGETLAVELSRAWERGCDSLGGLRLVVDLVGVTAISRGGRRVLRAMKNHGRLLRDNRCEG